MLRPSALLVAAALAGGCSQAPPPPAAPPAVTLSVDGQTLELSAARIARTEFRPGLDALVLDAGEGDRALHLVLLGPDYAYRRPPELPPHAQGDSWLRLDQRWLEAAQVQAQVDRSQPDLVRLRLRGTLLDRDRTVPLQGEVTVRVPKRW